MRDGENGVELSDGNIIQDKIDGEITINDQANNITYSQGPAPETQSPMKLDRYSSPTKIKLKDKEVDVDAIEVQFDQEYRTATSAYPIKHSGRDADGQNRDFSGGKGATAF